ncbi:glycosyltransferase [Candidatus Parcubacteria bacterium]|nr:MAG: glycosyltransferase [Candidatus Parcubacteria bacterium]
MNLVPVPVQPHARSILRRYRTLNPGLFRRLRRAGGRLTGTAVLHISATPRGGGVAEILQSEVALEQGLGMDSRWLVIRAPRKFFAITKKIHNLLQGAAGKLTEQEKGYYLAANREFVAAFARAARGVERAVVVVHDPQPLAMIGGLPAEISTVLRLHIDLATPDPATLEFFRPMIDRYDRVIVSERAYLVSLPWLRRAKARVIFPAIDPLSEKNRPMSRRAAERLLLEFGIDCSRPLVTQVSRFDPWKDPIGVVQAYYRAKNDIPDLQLALAGLRVAVDDPEAEAVFRKVRKFARGDSAIHLFGDHEQLKTVSGDRFVSALYTASDVVIQKSIREGFGLTVAEALWKGKPVVAGMTIGTKAQIQNGKNGLLVASPEEAASAIIKLMRDRRLAARLGAAGKKSVQQRFLLPRLALDMANVFGELV